MSSSLLAEAERILQKHSPADFETTLDAGPERVDVVRHVEDTEAWKAAYPSLDAFYAAYEARHPEDTRPLFAHGASALLVCVTRRRGA